MSNNWYLNTDFADIHELQNTCLNESCGPNDLAECEENDGQPYIPYQLAKIYITKVCIEERYHTV